MLVHFIQNGVVINTVESDTLDNPFGYLAIASDVARIGWTYSNGVFTAPPEPPPVIPTVVSARQIRQALTQANLRTTVENAVASGSQDLKDWYEFSTEFMRSHPQVIALATQLNITDAQLDNLWTLANSL